MFLPFLKDQRFLSMGLSRLSKKDWILIDEDWVRMYQHKRDVLNQRHAHCVQSLPESVAAQAELKQELLTHLSTKPDLDVGVHSLTHRPSGTIIVEDADSPIIEQASRWVPDDLCILQDSDVGYRLTAASLCSPSYWHLEDKIGQSLDEIHAPLPGYQQALARQLNEFFKRIKVGNGVLRGNWSIVTHPGLLQRYDPETPGDLESDPLIMRVERQTIVRLPSTNAICFTIRILQYPLADVLANKIAANALSQAYQQLSEQAREYKSLSGLSARLDQLLMTK